VQPVVKRQPDQTKAQAHPRNPAPITPKRLRLVGAASPKAVRPELKEFIDALSDLLAAAALKKLARPRLRLRHRPVMRTKPEFVVRRVAA